MKAKHHLILFPRVKDMLRSGRSSDACLLKLKTVQAVASLHGDKFHCFDTSTRNKRRSSKSFFSVLKNTVTHFELVVFDKYKNLTFIVHTLPTVFWSVLT